MNEISEYNKIKEPKENEDEYSNLRFAGKHKKSVKFDLEATPIINKVKDSNLDETVNTPESPFKKSQSISRDPLDLNIINN